MTWYGVSITGSVSVPPFFFGALSNGMKRRGEYTVGDRRVTYLARLPPVVARRLSGAESAGGSAARQYVWSR